MTVAGELDVDRDHVGACVVDRVRDDVEPGITRSCRELGASLVVDVDRGRVRELRCEEARLRGEVRVERAVVVEVLVTQVGEAHRGEVHAVDPMLFQRV